MNTAEKWVTTTDALIAAIQDESISKVVISGRCVDVPTIRLSPGRSLCGAAEGATIAFTPGADGVGLSSDNSVHDLYLCASPEKRAIFNDTACTTLGRIKLHGVTTTGRVQILARGQVRGGHVDVKGLEIIAADARAESERPHGYGVYVDETAIRNVMSSYESALMSGDSGFGVINSITIPETNQSVAKLTAKSNVGTRAQYRRAVIPVAGAIAAPIMNTVSSFGVATSITIDARSQRLANIATTSKRLMPAPCAAIGIRFLHAYRVKVNGSLVMLLGL